MQMSVLWSGLVETAAETHLVNLNTEVDGGEELLLFATMVKYLNFYRGLITMCVDFLIRDQCFVFNTEIQNHERLSPVWILKILS